MPPLSTLAARATHAQRTRAHFYPQHWLLCHMGLYKFEFEFDAPSFGFLMPMEEITKHVPRLGSREEKL